MYELFHTKLQFSGKIFIFVQPDLASIFAQDAKNPWKSYPAHIYTVDSRSLSSDRISPPRTTSYTYRPTESPFCYAPKAVKPYN